MIGILLVDKPKGITSHDVVSRVRRIFKTKRVGHAGTLDPLADGLLVLAVGPATRFLNSLDLEPKRYEAVVRFGEETSTYDAEGEVICCRPVPKDLDEILNDILPSFLGEIIQIPPLFSAIKKDGRPLYDYARRGLEVEVPARQVLIHSLSFARAEREDEGRLTVTCGGGTYIRSLAHDLGQAVGCGGHIVELRRTGAGRFSVDQAKRLEELTAEDLLPLSQALKPLPMICLSSRDEEDIRQGRRIKAATTADLAALCTDNGEVFALARRIGEELQPVCVIPTGPLD